MKPLRNPFEARMKRWRRSWANGLTRSRRKQLIAWFDMLVFDHGVFRFLYSNYFRLSPHMARCNHPSPIHVARLARQGVRTIINLRGPNNYGSYHLTRMACAKHRIRYVNFRVKSRQMPTKSQLLGAKELFSRIRYPAVMHCKSGADRVGLMSALYVIYTQHATIEKAMQQLSLKYGHIRQAKTGMLNFFFASYCKRNQADSIDFIDWIETEYNPTTLTELFHDRGWVNWFVDKILRRE